MPSEKLPNQAELDSLKRRVAELEEVLARAAGRPIEGAGLDGLLGEGRHVEGLLWTNNARGEMEGEQPGWAAFTGQSPAEYRGYGWADAVHPEDAQPTIDAWNRAVAERTMFGFEHRVRRRDGVWRLFNIRALPMMDDQGEITKWVGIHTDITEQRQAEKDQHFLVRLGAELADINDTEEVAQRATYLVGSYLDVQRCGWMTVSVESGTFTIEREYLREPCPALVGTYPLHFYGASGVLEQLSAGMTVSISDTEVDERTAPQYDTTFRHRGTRAILFIPLVRGRAWKGILAVAEPVRREWSEREATLLRAAANRIWPRFDILRALDRERQTNEKLAESEARFRQLAQADVVGVVIRSAEDIIEANDYFARMLGYSSEEVIGLRWPQVIAEDSARAAANRQAELERFGKCSSHELAFCRKDGASAPALVGGVGIGGPQQPLFLEIVIDLTERKKLEEQFRQAQKLESVGQLAGGVAHDFNNLLTIISGYADMLTTETEVMSNATLLELIHPIVDASAKAAALTKQLMAFSRKQARRIVTFDVGESVRRVEKMLRRLLPADVCLELRLEGHPLWLRADPTHIEQVLINLVLNARDALPAGGRILLQTRPVLVDDNYAASHLAAPVGPYVELSVSDDGIGMSKEVQAHLFEPFFTTKEVGRGTGLGLATVHGIVKESGGTIRVYSEIGKGSAFRILLPAADVSAPASDFLPQVPSRSGKGLIVVAEDEADLRKYVREVLERAGYSVLEAVNGKEAIELAEQYPETITLLVSDIVMPVMGGVELAERWHSILPGVPVLQMSGYAERVGDASQSSINYIQKPFTPSVLLTRIEEILSEGSS